MWAVEALLVRARGEWGEESIAPSSLELQGRGPGTDRLHLGTASLQSPRESPAPTSTSISETRAETSQAALCLDHGGNWEVGQGRCMKLLGLWRCVSIFLLCYAKQGELWSLLGGVSSWVCHPLPVTHLQGLCPRL